MSFRVQLQREVSENGQASCCTLWGMTSLSDVGLEVCAWCTQWGGGSVCDLSVLLPPLAQLLYPPEYPFRPSLSHTKSPCYTIFDTHQNLPLLYPTDKILESQLEENSMLYALLFQSMNVQQPPKWSFFSMLKHLQTESSLLPPLLGIHDC